MCTCSAGGGRNAANDTKQPIVTEMSALEQVRKIQINDDLKAQPEELKK